MKGILNKNGVLVFRVNLDFYPRELAVKTFGGAYEKNEKYLVFKKKVTDANAENKIYEKFNRMLEEIKWKIK